MIGSKHIINTMKKKKLLLIALLLVGAASSFAAKVDTLLVKSPSMNKDIKVVVVTPDAALGKKATACPTVYLLHGFGGHAKTWIEIKPNLPQIADEKESYLFARTEVPAGIGTVRKTRLSDMKLLSHRNW